MRKRIRKFIHKYHYIGLLLAVAVLVAACQTDGTTQSVIRDVCPALTGPIVYNSKNKNSAYHAGPKLAPQLARQNNVGVNLHCPPYR